MERRIPVLVIFFVVGKIISATDTSHPFGVASVPIYRLTQAFVERYGWLPTQLTLHFATAKSVAAVMARTVLYITEQGFRFSRHAEEASCHREILFNIYASKIIDFADVPAFENS